jgi:hypothetical protein
MESTVAQNAHLLLRYLVPDVRFLKLVSRKRVCPIVP